MGDWRSEISIRRQLWRINAGMACDAHPFWFKGIALRHASPQLRTQWLIEKYELGLMDLSALKSQSGMLLLMSKAELSLLVRVATAMVLVDDLRLQVFGQPARNGLRVAGNDAISVAARLEASYRALLRHPQLLYLAGRDVSVAWRFARIQRCLILALCNGLHPHIGQRLRLRFRPSYFDSAKRVAQEKSIAASLAELAPLIVRTGSVGA